MCSRKFLPEVAASSPLNRSSSATGWVSGFTLGHDVLPLMDPTPGEAGCPSAPGAGDIVTSCRLDEEPGTSDAAANHSRASVASSCPGAPCSTIQRNCLAA